MEKRKKTGYIYSLPLSLNFADRYKIIFSVILLAAIFVVAFTVRKPLVSYLMSLGGVFGLLKFWRMTRIAELFTQDTYKYGSVIEFLEKIKYLKIDKCHYTFNSPRLLKFESQDIFIMKDANSIKIRGPLYLLKIINKRILC